MKSSKSIFFNLNKNFTISVIMKNAKNNRDILKNSYLIKIKDFY